jgi:hypothetical protein
MVPDGYHPEVGVARVNFRVARDSGAIRKIQANIGKALATTGGQSPVKLAIAALLQPPEKVIRRCPMLQRVRELCREE